MIDKYFAFKNCGEIVMQSQVESRQEKWLRFKKVLESFGKPPIDLIIELFYRQADHNLHIHTNIRKIFRSPNTWTSSYLGGRYV